jgi:hypothetical protein
LGFKQKEAARSMAQWIRTHVNGDILVKKGHAASVPGRDQEISSFDATSLLVNV